MGQLLTANDFYRDISAIVEDNSEDSIDMSHALIDDTVLEVNPDMQNYPPPAIAVDDVFDNPNN